MLRRVLGIIVCIPLYSVHSALVGSKSGLSNKIRRKSCRGRQSMKKISGYGLARFSVFALLVLALAIVLPAQIQNGQFQGTILDQSGAAVPNATVTATNSATGQSFTAHSSNSGFYTMNQVPVGTYN